MEVIGIIAEYNPFHNGHLYQINKIKEKYPDSIIVVALNGYFLERGEISILTKEDKTKIALENGIDLIVEIPFLFGSQSADIFANCAIKLLNELKINKLIFGSESNNIAVLENIAKKQINYEIDIKKYLDEGLNYPTALKKALNIDFDYNNPNDLLAISYIKCILKNKYSINYESIKRTNDYHDLKSNENIISASNIRNKLNNNINISSYVPFEINKYSLYTSNENIFNLLKYKIITESNLSNILTVDEGIENKLKKEIMNVNSIDELILKLKSKRYTYNRLKRMLVHILVNVLKDDAKLELDYIKILGFNNTGQKYLNHIKKELSIPLYNNKLNSKVKDYELRASLLYDLINNTNTYKYELRNNPNKN